MDDKKTTGWAAILAFLAASLFPSGCAAVKPKADTPDLPVPALDASQEQVLRPVGEKQDYPIDMKKLIKYLKTSGVQEDMDWAMFYTKQHGNITLSYGNAGGREFIIASVNGTAQTELAQMKFTVMLFDTDYDLNVDKKEFIYIVGGKKKDPRTKDHIINLVKYAESFKEELEERKDSIYLNVLREYSSRILK